MAKLLATSVLLLLLFSTVAQGGPAKEQGGRRGGKKKLSDKEHYDGDKHNAEYDHEAFLGKEQAKTFSELSPEEAKRRLGLIVDKIDTNGDGSVSEDEMVVWIRLVSRRYVFDDRDRHWEFHVPADQDYLSWDAYLEKSFGMVEDRTKIHDKNRNLTFNEIIDRYDRRFKKADRDGNNLLNKDEFADFLHPHDVPHMMDIVVDETFQDIDKNRDGKITMEEYIADMSQSYTPEHTNWKEMETENFRTRRDRNGNGFMDKEEVQLWMFPPSADPARNEAKHLFYHADLDKDKILTKAEILKHQDIFVGSQATEHGKFFVRHDEF